MVKIERFRFVFVPLVGGPIRLVYVSGRFGEIGLNSGRIARPEFVSSILGGDGLAVSGQDSCALAAGEHLEEIVDQSPVCALRNESLDVLVSSLDLCDDERIAILLSLLVCSPCGDVRARGYLAILRGLSAPLPYDADLRLVGRLIVGDAQRESQQGSILGHLRDGLVDRNPGGRLFHLFPSDDLGHLLLDHRECRLEIFLAHIISDEVDARNLRPLVRILTEWGDLAKRILAHREIGHRKHPVRLSAVKRTHPSPPGGGTRILSAIRFGLSQKCKPCVPFMFHAAKDKGVMRVTFLFYVSFLSPIRLNPPCPFRF